ncbi:hypothetical protein ABFV05_016702 [Capra hircus]
MRERRWAWGTLLSGGEGGAGGNSCEAPEAGEGGRGSSSESVREQSGPEESGQGRASRRTGNGPQRPGDTRRKDASGEEPAREAPGNREPAAQRGPRTGSPCRGSPAASLQHVAAGAGGQRAQWEERALVQRRRVCHWLRRGRRSGTGLLMAASSRSGPSLDAPAHTGARAGTHWRGLLTEFYDLIRIYAQTKEATRHPQELRVGTIPPGAACQHSGSPAFRTYQQRKEAPTWECRVGSE